MRAINKMHEFQIRRLQQSGGNGAVRPNRNRWILTRYGLALGLLFPAGLWLAGVDISEVVVPSIVGGILGGFLADILRDM
ncbi:MAG: hypothetical protein HY720_19580 [Planctomycetes bacterium]|nr:hypothetical protein [Planctomycetota bacterium]